MAGLTPEEVEQTNGGKDMKRKETCSTGRDFFRSSVDAHLGAVERDRFGYDWEYEDPRSVKGFRVSL